MTNKSCKNCLYGDQCSYTRPCQYFCPIEEDDDDLIESGRDQFAREWSAYVKESQDSDF